jgi:hypothetical protein
MRKSAPAAARPEDDASWGDDEFLDDMISGLPDGGARRVNIIGKLKGTYVECGRDAALAKTFNKFQETMFAREVLEGESEPRPGAPRVEGAVFFVTGESGAGKTSAVHHLLKQYPKLQPRKMAFGEVNPVISISLSGKANLTVIGEEILSAAGYSTDRSIGPAKLWKMIPRQLHHRKVLLVHIDEIQHMVKMTEKDHDRKEAAEALKGAMNYRDWPISFLMSGKPESIRLASLDEQIERRHAAAFLPSLSLPEQRVLIERMFVRLCSVAEIGVGSCLSGDLVERLSRSVNHRYGRVAKGVKSAIHEALHRDASELALEDFARAFLMKSHARGHDEMNPFLIDDWERLPPGTFFIEEEEAGR